MLLKSSIWADLILTNFVLMTQKVVIGGVYSGILMKENVKALDVCSVGVTGI